MLRQLKMYYTPILNNICHPYISYRIITLQYLNKNTWASSYMQRKVGALLKFQNFWAAFVYSWLWNPALSLISVVSSGSCYPPQLLMRLLICITVHPSHKNLNTEDNQRGLLHCLKFFLVIPISGMIVCISPVPSLIPDSSLPLALSTPRIFNPSSSTSQYSFQYKAG